MCDVLPLPHTNNFTLLNRADVRIQQLISLFRVQITSTEGHIRTSGEKSVRIPHCVEEIMEDDWEKLAEVPVAITKPPAPVNANKWDGEDEDDVKDSWEDEEEEDENSEKKDEEKAEAQAARAKPKKSLREKIAERERLKQEEMEARAREREENMTPEERIAEKLRLQKIQEEADLRAAMDTFGVTSDKTGLDGFNPTNKAELAEFGEALKQKISQFKLLEDYPTFLEELVRDLCVSLNSTNIQKVKKTVDNLYAEKQKLDKEKSKKGGKGKSKASLRLEEDNANIKEYGQYESYDYDDFM